MSDLKRSDDQVLIYLFGAGASYPSLPLAREVSRRMLYWGQYLQKEADGQLPELNKKNLSEFSSELTLWGTEATSHYSVDTLAKKLFLTNRQDELWRLKAAMSAFFMIEQAATRAESRYDSFFAAILEQPGRPPTIPEHIWMLTWNYDRQFERAYHQYCPDPGKVQDNITFCKRVIRLNGLLGRAINKGTGDEYNLDLSSDKNKVIGRVLDEYLQLRTHQPAITFAFEKMPLLESQLGLLSSKRCILIVVGYSFPFFNRRFDKLVLNSIRTVDKVFLQVLPEHASAISSRVKTLRDFPSIQIVDDKDQFFVPYEYD